MAKLGGSVGAILKGLSASEPNTVAEQLRQIDALHESAAPEFLTPAAPPSAPPAQPPVIEEPPSEPPQAAEPQPEAAPPQAAEPSPSEPPAAPASNEEVETHRQRADMAEADARRYQAAHKTLSGMYAKAREQLLALEQQIAERNARIAELEESAKAHPAGGAEAPAGAELSEDVLGPDLYKVFKWQKEQLAQLQSQLKALQKSAPAQQANDPKWDAYISDLDALIPDRGELMKNPAFKAWLNVPGTYRQEQINQAEGDRNDPNARRDAFAVARIVDQFRASTRPATPSAGQRPLAEYAMPPSRSTPPPLHTAGNPRRYTESDTNRIMKDVAEGRPMYDARGARLDPAQRKAALDDVRLAYAQGRVDIGR